VAGCGEGFNLVGDPLQNGVMIIQIYVSGVMKASCSLKMCLYKKKQNCFTQAVHHGGGTVSDG
jgi:hypothetical protein